MDPLVSLFTTHRLEQRIVKDLFVSVTAILVFSCVAYFLGLLDNIAQLTGVSEFKEMDPAIAVMIYATWLVGIFVLRRLYDLRRIMTQRQAVEEELRQSRKMAAIGTMSRGVAHDFRNLMMIIQGMIEVHNSTTGNDSPDSPDLKHATEASERAERLADQLMRLGRQQPVDMNLLDLNEVISDMANILRHLAGENITIHTALEDNVETVTANKGQIEEVILNLVTNACETMSDGGDLTIGTSRAQSYGSSESKTLDGAPSDYVVVTVTDTGCGMDAATKSHVFEPYFTTKETGTGLGLATVHSIVKQNRGTVEVESEKGKGTSFNIYLPTSEQEADPREVDGPISLV